MAQYATASDLSTFLQCTFDADETTRADLILEAVSDEIQAFSTRVDFEETADDTVSLRGSWKPELDVPGGPISSVSAVSIDNTDLAATDYQVHEHSLVRQRPTVDQFDLRRGLHWGGSRRRVSITYTHGFTEVPPLVEKMTLRAGARAWINPEGRRSITLESGAGTNFGRDDGGVYLTKADLNQLVMAGFRWSDGNTS